jgi:hypothetical protein
MMYQLLRSQISSPNFPVQVWYESRQSTHPLFDFRQERKRHPATNRVVSHDEVYHPVRRDVMDQTILPNIYSSATEMYIFDPADK